MQRGTAIVVLIAGSVLSPPPLTAAAAPEQRVALIAYRTTTGAAALDFQIDAPPGERPSLIASALATADRGRIQRIDLAGAFLSGDADRARVHAAGRRTALCDHGVCAADVRTYTAGMAISIRNAAGDDSFNVMFVVAHGASVHYTAKAKGWVVRRASLPYRVVAGGEVTEAGVYGLGTGAEKFSAATAPGGPTGSIAVSEPPCSQAASGIVSRGVGTLALDGGATRPTFTCPTSRGNLASWNHRRTTWRVHGTVAGETTMAGARLFVMDLPRRLPAPGNWPWR